LNPNYKNTISRVTEIDSQYRPTLFQCNYPESCLSPYLSQASETMFSSKLTDTLNNTVSLKVSAINIPFSFYNVESNQGNSVYSLSGEQHIPNGYYDLSGLLSQLQTSFLGVSYDSITGKTTLTNTSGSDLQITFYDNQQSLFQDTHINHSLGWMLGFRNITCSGDDIYSSYTISTSITSEYISFIPTIKYFVVTADDHNHNQSSKSLVQLSQGKEYIKPTPYYNNDTSTYRRSNTCTTTTTIHNEASNSLCLDSLSKNDLISTNYDHHKLTKKQLYTRASINDTNQESSLKIEQHAMSNILAIIPFEAKSLTWGQSTFFSDKNQYAREYHGPVDIEKLSIRLYDDKGHILNLNGQDWSMTLLSKHLYKY